MITLRVGDGFVELLSEGKAAGGRRELSSGISDEAAAFVQRYEETLTHGGEQTAALLDIGRELSAWLDGADGAWSRILDATSGPVVFEVQGPAHPGPEEMAVLRAPWELLADDQGFLANVREYVPYRRLGRTTGIIDPDEFRLGVMFMASSPHGSHELDFEAEELAILRATGDIDSIDVVVEDSGDPTQLGRQIAALSDPPPVLHLSCHGNNQPEAVLAMEDAHGSTRLVTARNLHDDLRPHVPSLLFLSACLSAAAGNRDGNDQVGEGAVPERSAEDQQIIHSLATALIDAGMPAVLGWSGSVSDVAATVFARSLYAGLSRTMTIAEAVAMARRDLLNPREVPAAFDHPKDLDELEKAVAEGTAKVCRRDWHLARLWLGPTG
ncbi:MAG: CHAT domain-containing protein, partial [Planctomycetes bacterium]|nr:CHAT domain-containing protein [Planctomycetota bacterium]